MNQRLIVCLLVVSGIIVAVAAWRLFLVYRRRKRWQMLMTSHQSVHIARKRIITGPPPSDED